MVNAVHPLDASSGYYYGQTNRSAAVNNNSNNAFALLALNLNNANDSLVQDSTAYNDDILNTAGFSSIINLDVQQAISQIPGGAAILGDESVLGGSGTLLTQEQEDKIRAIIATHKDEPISAETYDKIQADLRAQGLAPEQLALKNQFALFDPTGSVLGSSSSASPDLFGASFGDSQSAQISYYTEQVVSLWLGLSLVPQGGIVNLVG